MKSKEIECPICNKQFSSRKIRKHLEETHGMPKDSSLRFSWIKNLHDTLIDPTPHYCKICGKPAKFMRRSLFGKYSETCSVSCKNKLNNEKYFQKIEKETGKRIRPFGFENKEFRDKTLKAVQEKYKVSNVSQLDFVKQKKKETLFKHYGKWFSQTEEWREKVKKTCLEKYGVDSPNKTLEKIEQCYKTKKKNHTFSYSSLEEKMNEVLCKIYGNENVIREYQDKRYQNPLNGHLFSCDFYVKPLDLFIEIQGAKCHGLEPYKKGDLSEKFIKDLKEKIKNSEDNKKKYYEDCLDWYTRVDPMKREAAKKNNLKYLEIFWKRKDMYTLEKISSLINAYLNDTKTFVNISGELEIL